ncbi:N-formylglutamate amidohydrolase [Qipengyuania marisflavi]|uniref:N-formylglutamate amidohydrolase n=1 Tax=Qipengyuania marisflavi TaxID=2486356 RepID=A0A5S3P9H0_9SPHN|nr:N-formylglutamate amidohydrolase [Qipengyuania marisflavi]TMM50159.1 N-formylglutamate amidohydrolase [Qipengyuania marisflavi]
MASDEKTVELQDSAASTGGKIASGGAPAYRLWGVDKAPLPILIAVPHAGRAYPVAVIGAMRDPARSRLRLEDRHVDALAREVAAQTGAALIMAEAPRAMLDLNRATDDVDWGMIAGAREREGRHSAANRRARSGLGLVPRRLPGSGEIWRGPLPREELNSRIAGIHRPYHTALGTALETLRDRWGAALLLDLHSMPPLKARFPDEHAPEFVIGDRFGISCNPLLSAASLRFFAGAGRAAAHNRPYSGGYVLDRHGAPARGMHALQLEVCRTAYLDARLDEPSARLPGVARLLVTLVRTLADNVVALARQDGLSQAAE